MDLPTVPAIHRSQTRPLPPKEFVGSIWASRLTWIPTCPSVEAGGIQVLLFVASQVDWTV